MADENTLKSFRDVVESRRSVRVYDGTPMPEDVVRDCVRMAQLAPNSSNLQQWEFHWVRDSAKKAALVTACLSQPAAKTAAELIVVVARRDTWRQHAREMAKLLKTDGSTPKAVLDYYEKLMPIALTQGPFSIFGLLKRIGMTIFGLFRPVPRGPFSHSDMAQWAVKSTALACENLMLAARAHGFDSCPMEGFDASRVARILGTTCRSEIVMVISLGKRAPTGVYGPRVRFPEDRFFKIH